MSLMNRSTTFAIHRANPRPHCFLSDIFTDPFCSPITAVLFTICIAFVLASLYTILRKLYIQYQNYQYERDMENEAYERLLRRLAEAESNFDDSLAVSVNPRDDVDDIDEDYSNSAGTRIVRRNVSRQSTGYEMPLIEDTRAGTIAQRRRKF